MKNKLIKQSIQLTASIMWVYFKIKIIHFLWSISFLDSVYYKRKRIDFCFKIILLNYKYYISHPIKWKYEPKPPKFESGFADFASDCVIENNKCEPIVNK